MGFFKKKKNKEGKDAAPKHSDNAPALKADTDDPLGLGQLESQEAPGPKDAERPRSGEQHMPDDHGAGVGAVPQRTGSGTAAKQAAEGKARRNGGSLTVMTNAARYLASVAMDTRGLFEEVRPVEEAQAVEEYFRDSAHVPKSAVLSGAFDPHAAASLIVFELRDSEEPLVTAELREDVLSDSSLADEAARFEALRDTLQLLPAPNRSLLGALAELGVAVSHEHAACYQDGLETRMEGLAQLLGPLITRPRPSCFESDMAAAVSFATDLLKNPSLLSAPLRVPSSDSEPPAPPAQPSHAPPPSVPLLSLPSHAAPTPRAVTFRESGAGGGPVDDGEDSDETNYNQVKTKTEAHAEFVRQVSSLSDAQRKQHLQGAMRGGPLLKYSSRGREVALHFFKVSEDVTSLNWAHAATPTDLKYGFPLDSAMQVCAGRLADGSFHGAASDSHPELRLVLRLVGGLQLELEALNRASLDMWAIALQHLLSARSTLPVALPFDQPANLAAFMPYTHRDRGLLPGSGPDVGAGGPGGQEPAPAYRSGAATARLLEEAARQSAPAGRARPSTARPQRQPLQQAGGPRGPMTARGPREQEELPDVTAINVQVMISKARHNRHKELVALLDRDVPVDAADVYGNTVLIVGCQNGHKRIVKEALRRYCNMDHQNKKGNTGLHFCFAYKYEELGRYLIDKGADDTICNKRGKTCYEVLDRAEMNDYADDPDDPDPVDNQPPNLPPPPQETASKKEAEEMERLREKMRELEKENSMLRTQHTNLPPSASIPAASNPPDAATIPAVPAPDSHGAAPPALSPSKLSAASKRGPPAAPKPVAGLQEAASLEALGLVVSPPQMESASTVQIGGRFERYSSESAVKGFGAGVGLFKQVVDAKPLEESGVMCEPKLTGEAVARISERHPLPPSQHRAPSVASTARSIGGLENVLNDAKKDVERAEEVAAQVLTPFAVDDSASEAEAGRLTCEAVLKIEQQQPLPANKYRAPSVASTARSIGGLRGVLDEVKHDVEAVEEVRWGAVGQMVDGVKHDVQHMEQVLAHVTTPFAVDDAVLPDPALSPTPLTVAADAVDISVFARSPCPPLMTPPLDLSVASPAAPEKERAPPAGSPDHEPVAAARQLVAKLDGKSGGGADGRPPVAQKKRDAASADGARAGTGGQDKLAAIFGSLGGRGKYSAGGAVSKAAGHTAALPPRANPAAKGGKAKQQGGSAGDGFSDVRGKEEGEGERGDVEAAVGVLSIWSDSGSEGEAAQNESLEALETDGGGAAKPSASASALATAEVLVEEGEGLAGQTKAPGGGAGGGDGEGSESARAKEGEEEGGEAPPTPPERVRKAGRGRAAAQGGSVERTGGAGRGMRVKAGTGSAGKNLPIMSPAQRLKR